MPDSPEGLTQPEAPKQIKQPKFQSDHIRLTPQRDPETSQKRTGIDRREFFTLAREAGKKALIAVGAMSITEGALVKFVTDKLKREEYTSAQPYPLETGKPQTTEARVKEIRRVIDAHEPFTLAEARQFAEELVAPLFVEQGRKLGFPRNLEAQDLMRKSTFIPDFNNIHDQANYQPVKYQEMIDLAAKLKRNDPSITDTEVNGAYLWEYLRNDPYYQSIKDNYDAKKELLLTLYDEAAISFTQFENGGHVFFNVAAINDHGREFHDTKNNYYLTYQRPDIENNPQVCKPITYGAAMLKILVHEWTHLDSEQGFPDIPNDIPSLDGSPFVEALKRNGFDPAAQKPPITDMSTYNFGLVGFGADKSMNFYASSLLEFTTDLLATKLIASVGLPPVLEYHTGMDYRNMEILLKSMKNEQGMSMDWGDLAKLYYDSNMQELYRRIGEVIVPNKSDVDKIAAGLQVFTPNGLVQSPFPWKLDNGTIAGINWKELHTYVHAIDPRSFIELHQPYDKFPEGIGNWWAYALLDKYEMEQPIN